MFGRNVTEKENNNQKLLYSPLHLNSASALPGKTRNREIASFSLKYCMLFFQQTQNT